MYYLSYSAQFDFKWINQGPRGPSKRGHIFEERLQQRRRINKTNYYHISHRCVMAYSSLNMMQSISKFGLISFKRTKNNTYCVISPLFEHKTLGSISGGQISKSNGRRKTHGTQRMLFKHVIEKLMGFGFTHLVIHCKGKTVSKQFILKNFFKHFKILLVKDLSTIAHNGCRTPSVRRL